MNNPEETQTPITENPHYIEFQRQMKDYGDSFYGSPVDQESKYAIHTFSRVLGNVENLPLGLEKEVLESGTARVSIRGRKVTVRRETTEIRIKGKKTVKLVIDKTGGDYSALLRIGSQNVNFNGEIQTPLRKAVHALVV